jgi:hypothetical protein
MNTQEQQDEIRILGLIIKMRQGSEEPICCTAMVLRDCTGISTGRCKGAVTRLIDKGELEGARGAYAETIKGRQRYHDAVSNPAIPGSLQEWREQALTGAREGQTSNGYKTLLPCELQNPAVPGPETRPFVSPLDAILASEKIRNDLNAVAKNLGINLKELMRHYSEGRLRVCKRHGKAHWGIFDKKKNGWKSWCRRCTKEARRPTSVHKKS